MDQVVAPLVRRVNVVDVILFRAVVACHHPVEYLGEVFADENVVLPSATLTTGHFPDPFVGAGHALDPAAPGQPKIPHQHPLFRPLLPVTHSHLDEGPAGDHETAGGVRSQQFIRPGWGNKRLESNESSTVRSPRQLNQSID